MVKRKKIAPKKTVITKQTVGNLSTQTTSKRDDLEEYIGEQALKKQAWINLDPRFPNTKGVQKEQIDSAIESLENLDGFISVWREDEYFEPMEMSIEQSTLNREILDERKQLAENYISRIKFYDRDELFDISKDLHERFKDEAKENEITKESKKKRNMMKTARERMSFGQLSEESYESDNPEDKEIVFKLSQREGFNRVFRSGYKELSTDQRDGITSYWDVSYPDFKENLANHLGLEGLTSQFGEFLDETVHFPENMEFYEFNIRDDPRANKPTERTLDDYNQVIAEVQEAIERFDIWVTGDFARFKQLSETGSTIFVTSPRGGHEFLSIYSYANGLLKDLIPSDIVSKGEEYSSLSTSWKPKKSELNLRGITWLGNESNEIARVVVLDDIIASGEQKRKYYNTLRLKFPKIPLYYISVMARRSGYRNEQYDDNEEQLAQYLGGDPELISKYGVFDGWAGEFWHDESIGMIGFRDDVSEFGIMGSDAPLTAVFPWSAPDGQADEASRIMLSPATEEFGFERNRNVGKRLRRNVE
ncbi:hypothetical protein LCGC14_0504840 [marine sediment metagenome]|uniref:Uncharacterized protein n=1 Tax=marine sediment metagenome TaxID=412755 RepID=A0A0F9UPP6_9ZZZZ